MPQLGESVAEGTIGKWLKKPGDHVAKYEPLLEVITDKVNAEVPSPFEGILKEILVEEGATVPNNAEIAVIEEAGAAAAAEAPAPPEVSRRRSSSTTARAASRSASGSRSPARRARLAMRTASTLGGRSRRTGWDDIEPPGGSAWESNPPRHAERSVTGFEDRGTHRDPSAPPARW